MKPGRLPFGSIRNKAPTSIGASRQIASARRRACQQVLDGVWTEQNAATFNLADQLENEIETKAPDVFTGAYSDLLQAALDRVNWHELAERYLLKVQSEESAGFSVLVFAYTRTQAIQDGVLVDVSQMAREAGIKHPTAVTSAVWSQYVAVPEGVDGQDENGRLWDILNMFRFAALKSPRDSELLFDLVVKNDERAPQPVTLKAVCGPGDMGEPVLTIMLPDED